MIIAQLNTYTGKATSLPDKSFKDFDYVANPLFKQEVGERIAKAILGNDAVLIGVVDCHRPVWTAVKDWSRT